MTNERDSPTWQVDFHSGTNLGVAIAPSTGQLAVSVQGSLWLLPPDGGHARPAVPQGFECVEANRPSWSPDGSWLAFQTNQDGYYHLWKVNVADGVTEQLTFGPNDDRDPTVSPDGKRIAFASDRTGSYQVWVLDVHDGVLTQWTNEPGEAAMPAWHPDGDAIAYVLDNHDVRVATRNDVRTAYQDSASRLFAPSFNPDGIRFSCVAINDLSSSLMLVEDGVGTALTESEDISPLAADWLSKTELVYASDGAVRRRHLESGSVKDIPFIASVTGRSSDLTGDDNLFTALAGPVRGIVDPVLSPSGTKVAFHALGSVWVGNVHGRPQPLPGADALQTSPAWFPDGKRLVYSSDLGGTPDLWQFDTGTEEHCRLTALPGAQTCPAVSPEGTRIAFQDHENKTFILDTRTRNVRQVLPALNFPGKPSWTPSGETLSLFSHVPASRSYREGEHQLLLVDIETGNIRYISFSPYGALSGQEAAPAWSPDGRYLAIVLDGALHLCPVTARGEVTGPPRRLTDDTVDYPSWSADSRTLLYRHHGRFHRVTVEGKPGTAVQMELERTKVTEPERTELYVGALWDGQSDNLIKDARIVVEAGRIVSVEDGVPATTLNALPEGPTLTAMPGLIDMHTHVGLLESTYGRRVGLLNLAYGVTTVRSAGDPANLAAALYETYANAEKLAPRYVPTGDLLDGVRCHETRPVSNEVQLLQEIERLHALGMRYVKVYNRLPTPWHALVVHEAHRRGMRVMSHHLYPGVLAGQDSLEHLVVSSNRIHTLVSKIGNSQQDVIDLIAKSGLTLTPTLFDSSAMHFDDPTLVADERLRKLMPDWAYERLQDKASAFASAQPVAARQRLDRLVASIRLMLDEGSSVTTGTDIPLDDIGLAVHLNLRALVRGGIRPVAALRTATIDAATAMGYAHEIGVVRPGQLADLVFVHGDPTTRIEAAADVQAVMLGGRLHRTEQLYESRGRETLDAVPMYQELTFDTLPPEFGEHWWHDPDTWNAGPPKQARQEPQQTGSQGASCC